MRALDDFFKVFRSTVVMLSHTTICAIARGTA
jgi:hypothetical protein